MKLKRRVACIVLTLITIFSLVACGKNDSIEGSWKTTKDGIVTEYKFNKDGTGTTSNGNAVDINYKLEEDKITITRKVLGVETDETLTYKVEKDKLTLTNTYGETIELTRQ